MTFEREIQALRNILARLGLDVRPIAAEDGVVLDAASLLSIGLLIHRDNSRSAEGQRILTLIGGYHRGREPRTLTAVDALALTQSLARLATARDRFDRISRGQFVGPMSGSEAMRFLRGRHGRR